MTGLMTAQVTPQEAAIADALGEVWNRFLDLPVEHPGDNEEFCRGVHILQRQITSRAGRRAMRARVRTQRDIVLDALGALEQHQPPRHEGNLYMSIDEYLAHTAVRNSVRNKSMARALIEHDRVLTSYPRGF